MKITARSMMRSIAATLVMSLALGSSAALATPVGLIDDFTTPGLSEYNLYKILDQNAGTSNISFNDNAGSLAGVSTGTTGAEQVLFFRNDGVTLSVGQELQVDGPIFDSGTGTEDLGLAVGELPTSLGNPAAGSTRNLADYAFISFRNINQLNSRGFNNGAEIPQIQNFGVTADTLFIARLANNDMELGYYTGNVRTVTRTITPSDPAIYSHVGFYADLRTDLATISGLDNLRLVPEPSSLALLGLSMFGLLARRRS
jgi:hypothetical protein